jgi:hypothetical protein
MGPRHSLTGGRSGEGRMNELLFPMGVWMCSWNGVLVVPGALFKELPDLLVISR